MMDGLPKSVRVGPHDIRFADLTGADAKKNFGTFDPSTQEICLKDKYPSGSQAVDTVLHEVLHAIFSVGGVEPKQGEEHIVLVLGTFMTQVIRDNPELIAWMQKTVKK